MEINNARYSTRNQQKNKKKIDVPLTKNIPKKKPKSSTEIKAITKPPTVEYNSSKRMKTEREPSTERFPTQTLLQDITEDIDIDDKTSISYFDNCAVSESSRSAESLDLNDISMFQDIEENENSSKTNELLAVLNEIDSVNAEYVHQLCLEKNVNAKQLTKFDRSFLGKLFPRDQLGILFDFTAKFEKWKTTFFKSPDSTNIGNSKSLAMNLNHDSIFEITLTNILPSALMMNLKKKYEKYQTLGCTEQNLLSRAIVDFYILNNINMDKFVYQNLTQQILVLFPNELQETYYEGVSTLRKSGRAKGKLIHRFQNMKKKSSTETPSTSTPTSTLTVKYIQPVTCVQAQQSLNNNEVEIKEKWQLSQNLRLQEFGQSTDQNIGNIINEWPSIKQSISGDLISIDFEALYKNKADIFWRKWDSLQKCFPKIFSLYLKDIKLKRQYSKAKQQWSSLSQNSKDTINILMLNGCLRSCRKSSIADSQNAIIKIMQTPMELKNSMGDQPFIAVVGEVFDLSASRFYVFIDNTRYSVESLPKAISLCFMAFHVFNLEYPEKGANFWTFVQHFLYDIKSDNLTARTKCIGAYINVNLFSK